MKKRMISILLVLVLIAVMIPSTAFAEEVPDVDENGTVEYSIDGGTTWVKDHILNAIFECYKVENSAIRLINNIVLGDIENYYAPVLCSGGKSLTVEGNGYTIRRGTFTGPFFHINSKNSNVTLRNITLDGGAVWSEPNDVAKRTNSGQSVRGNGHLIALAGGASLTLDRGTVLQNNHLENNGYYGGAINAKNSGTTLTMKDGAIIRNNTAEGNKANNTGGGAGAVELDYGCVFNMEGGVIEGNYGSVTAGAVDVDGGSIFTMSGGVIRNNAAGNKGGGGVKIASGTFIMNAGTIANNQSVLGGGVAVTGGDMEVSGNSAVTGNTLNGTADNNIYLGAGKTITVTGELDDRAMFGVTTETKPSTDSPVAVTGTNDKDLSRHFVSDEERYASTNSADNVVQLTARTPITVSFDSNGGEGTMEEQVVYTGYPKPLIENTFIREGYFFAGWNTMANGTGNSYADREEILAEGSENITLYAQWTKIENTTNPENNALKGDIALTDEEVLEKVEITENEMASGKDIKIYLSVEDISTTVDETEKAAVMEEAGNDKIAVFLDVTMFKQVGDDTPEVIPQTTGEITVSVALPDKYINTDRYTTRTYYIIRSHGETVQKIDAEFDPETKILLFATDKFSTYAIAYSDVRDPSAPTTSYYPVAQKPVVEADHGAEVKLNSAGTTAEITLKDGYEIEKITVNGVPVEITTTLTGLKTGDKVVVSTRKVTTEPGDGERIEAMKLFKLVARSKMSSLHGKKAVKVYWYDENGADLKESGFDGYEIWRSTKRYSSYGRKPFFATTNLNYYNNLIKSGNKYYYKVRGYITVDGRKYYTDWSLKAWRTIK